MASGKDIKIYWRAKQKFDFYVLFWGHINRTSYQNILTLSLGVSGPLHEIINLEGGSTNFGSVGVVVVNILLGMVKEERYALFKWILTLYSFSLGHVCSAYNDRKASADISVTNDWHLSVKPKSSLQTGNSSKIGCLGPSSKVDFKKESSNETFQNDIWYLLIFVDFFLVCE